MTLRTDPNRDGLFSLFDDLFYYNNDTSFSQPGNLNGYTGDPNLNDDDYGVYDDETELVPSVKPFSANPNAKPLPDPEDCNYVDGNDGYIYVYDQDGTYVTKFESEESSIPSAPEIEKPTTVPQFNITYDENGNPILNIIPDESEPEYSVSVNPPVQEEAPTVNVQVVVDELGTEYWVYPDGTITDTSGKPLIGSNAKNEDHSTSTNIPELNIAKPGQNITNPDNDVDNTDNSSSNERPSQRPHRRPGHRPNGRPNGSNNSSSSNIINAPDGYTGSSNSNTTQSSSHRGHNRGQSNSNRGQGHRGHNRGQSNSNRGQGHRGQSNSNSTQSSTQSSTQNEVNYNTTLPGSAGYWAP